MNYKIIIEKKALKFLRGQSRSTQDRLLNAIYKLPDGDVKKMKNSNKYRLRVGDYRVIFSRDDVVKIIDVENIGNRGQIYKNEK